MLDLSHIAPGLEQRPDGIWYASRRSPIDYPDEANAFCFALEDRSFWFRYRNAFIVESVRRFPPAGWIADVGAGNGYVSLALQQSGFPSVVIEPGPIGIRNAHSRRLGPLVCSTLNDAGFMPGSLPAAGLFDVLEHIKDDGGLLGCLNELLAGGGRLYVTVPAFQSLWSAEDQLTGHHRRYTLGSLRRVLERSGFAVEYMTCMFAPLPAPVFALRALPWRLGFRRSLEIERTRAELQPGEGLITKLINKWLDIELSFVRRGRRIPFGTSCLAVARKIG